MVAPNDELDLSTQRAERMILERGWTLLEPIFDLYREDTGVDLLSSADQVAEEDIVRLLCWVDINRHRLWEVDTDEMAGMFLNITVTALRNARTIYENSIIY